MTAPDSRGATVSVVVITYRRPDFVRTNLEHLSAQTVAPVEVLIVDGSEDTSTAAVVEDFDFATYIRNLRGAGNMTSSRNAALPHATGDVMAFLDDDAFPAPHYIERLSSFCAARPDAHLGCARTLNGQPDEERIGVDRIGRFEKNGAVLGNFAADPGSDVPVDHGIGATMWIRRSLIEELGGFRELFTGVSVREDTDLFLRARTLSHQAWFVHDAVAFHAAAPKPKGERFDRRYQYSAARNDAVLLMANFGIRSRVFARSAFGLVPSNLSYGGAWYRRLARTAIVAAGYLHGVVAAIRTFGVGPMPPNGGYEHP